MGGLASLNIRPVPQDCIVQCGPVLRLGERGSLLREEESPASTDTLTVKIL